VVFYCFFIGFLGGFLTNKKPPKKPIKKHQKTNKKTIKKHQLFNVFLLIINKNARSDEVFFINKIFFKSTLLLL
jgi:hypothetical protein